MKKQFLACFSAFIALSGLAQNTPPVARPDIIQRYGTNGVKVPIALLPSNDSDADGDQITFLGVSSNSAAGGTVAQSGSWIFYTPPPGSTNGDSFTYSISDGRGAPVTGTVTVQVIADDTASENVVVLAFEDGSNLAQFNGIPGRTYGLEYSTNLTVPAWQPLGNATADFFGFFEYHDTSSPSSSQRYYRSVYPAPEGGGGSLYNDLLVNDLANVSTGESQSSYSTPSYQPAPNSLVIAVVVNSKASAPDTPAFTGNGLTWVQIGTTNFNTLASPTERLTVFRAQGASPTYGQGTAGFGGSETGCLIHVLELQGADATAANGSNAVVQVVYNGADAKADPHVCYATPSGVATNAMLLIYGDSVDSAFERTAPTNWVMLAQQSYDTPSTGMGLMFQCNALSTMFVRSRASSRSWGAIGLEIKPGLDDAPTTRPVLVQSYASYDANEPCNYFTNWLPNATLAGNLLLLHVARSYDATLGVNPLTVSDDKGNNWMKACTVTNVGQIDEDWYATNCIAGTQKIFMSQATTNANTYDFHWVISEFAHVALYQPLDTAASNLDYTLPLSLAGPVSTTADGDLLVVFVNDKMVMPSNPWQNFLSGGLHSISSQANLGECSGYAVQAKAGTVAPINYNPQPAPDTVNATALAFKRGSGGTVPSSSAIRIVRMQQDILVSATADTGWFAISGNLGVVVTTYVQSTGNITSINSVPASTWTRVVRSGGADTPALFYAATPATRQNPPVAFVYAKEATVQNVLYFDIVNAADSPYDTKAENEGAAAVDSDVRDATDITPGYAPGLVININANDNGPDSMSLDPAQIFDSPYYVGSTDGSGLSHGDAVQHVYNADTSQIAFGQRLRNSVSTSSPSSWYALAVCFKSK